MKYKEHDTQMENPRFKVKSKVRGRKAISPFETQGKLKVTRVNTVAPFPFPLIEKIQSPITIRLRQDHHNHHNSHNPPSSVHTENDSMLKNYIPGIFDFLGNNNYNNNNLVNFNNSCSIIET